MLKKMKANQVVNGSFGSLWIDNEKLSNIKSFEAKVELNYEEVNIAEDLGTHQKLMGYAGSGTMTLHKVDSFVLKKMKDGLAKGIIPEIMMVAKVEDPASIGAERVQLNEVTFDEFTLMKFEQKTIGEEEVPFKFASFTPLDLME
jgi:hypothetical protein